MDPQGNPSEQEMLAAWQNFYAAMTALQPLAAAQPELVLPPLPELGENPSLLCIFQWCVICTGLLQDYQNCINDHSGDLPAMQACCDTKRAARLAQFTGNCLAQS